MIFIIIQPMSTYQKICFVEVDNKYTKLFKTFSRFKIIGLTEKIDFIGLSKKYQKKMLECILPSHFFAYYSINNESPTFAVPDILKTPPDYYYNQHKKIDVVYPSNIALNLNDNFHSLLIDFWEKTLESKPKKQLTYNQECNRNKELAYLGIFKDPNFLNEIIINEVLI